MTVKELIKKLQEVENQDSLVYISPLGSGTEPVQEIAVALLTVFIQDWKGRDDS